MTHLPNIAHRSLSDGNSPTRENNAVLDDITGNGHLVVQVEVSQNTVGQTLHINVDGVCVMRICRPDSILVNDMRPAPITEEDVAIDKHNAEVDGYNKHVDQHNGRMLLSLGSAFLLVIILKWLLS